MERRALGIYPAVLAAERDLIADPTDSAGAMPRRWWSIRLSPGQDDRPPRTPWDQTVIYECHVKA